MRSASAAAAFTLALLAAVSGVRGDVALEPVACRIAANIFQSADCYTIRLPVDRADPASGTVTLPIVVLRASTDSPAPDPVVYLEGGPGAPTFDSGYPDFIDYSEFWWSHSTPFRRTRDFILFDQRGMGLAQPSLDCPELHKLDAALDRWPGYDDPVFDDEMAALAACHRRLVGEGVRLESFDTRNSAEDVADIVRALGYRQVNLYGISYGTRLALEVMRRHPRLVRSAVLDGVYPPDVDAELDFPAAVAGAFASLFEDCAADAGCNRVAPEASVHLEGLIDDLNRHPRMLELYDHDTYGRGIGVRFDGSFALSGMVDMLYDSDWLTYIPLVVGTAARGEVDALSYSYWTTTFASQGLAEGGFVNVECREALTLDPAALAEAARPYGIYGQVATTWSLVPLCDVWPVTRAPLASDGPVHSDIPALLMSGRYDPVTPPAFGERAAATLSRSAHLVFRAGGHAVTVGFTCARDAAATFFEAPEPSAVPPPRCRDYVRAPDFVTRF